MRDLTQQALALQGRPRRAGGSHAERVVERSKRSDEDFLQLQKKYAYPILWNQAVSTFWNQLEAYAGDLATLIIEHDRNVVLGDPALKKVQARLKKGAPPDEEWAPAAVHAIKQQAKSQGLRSKGVRQFEEVFETLGIPGTVLPRIDERLNEHSALRNVLVHRRGQVDARFLRDAPRFQSDVTSGDSIRLSFVHATVYGMSCVSYGASVLRRYCVKLGAAADHLEQVDRVINDHWGAARNHAPPLVR